VDLAVVAGVREGAVGSRKRGVGSADRGEGGDEDESGKAAARRHSGPPSVGRCRGAECRAEHRPASGSRHPSIGIVRHGI
jgi:hypothetical protein